MKIYKSISQLIGRTPLFEVSSVIKGQDAKATVLAKLEFFNPAGSVKDRAALQMIDDAEKAGVLKSGSVIIEPTSGNTGIGLAAIGASRGYKVILTMPDTMSIERRQILAAYGAEIVLTEGKLGMKGAIDKANELAKEYEGSFIPSQFENPSNPLAHFNTTGREIWEDTDGKLDIFVAGIGTGGTLSGVGRYLKSVSATVEVYGVEPASSPLITKGISGAHGLQGIGANFVPENFDRSVCDGVLTVTDEEAFAFGRAMAQKAGMLVGITSGAAIAAASRLAALPENEGKVIVALCPDTGTRYLSSKMFSKD